MTETYNGDWDCVTGDKVGKKVLDPYHPVYPDTGVYPGVRVWGSMEKPTVDVSRVRAVEVTPGMQGS